MSRREEVEAAFREGFQEGQQRLRLDILDAIRTCRQDETIEDDAWRISGARKKTRQRKDRP